MVPALLDSDQLELGNTLTQGVATLSMFVGPALAGIVIVVLASSSTKATPDMAGIGVAFALDTLSFLSLVSDALDHARPQSNGSRRGIQRLGTRSKRGWLIFGKMPFYAACLSCWSP